MPDANWRSGSRISTRRSASTSRRAGSPRRSRRRGRSSSLLVRLRGKDHWQTGDARRDLETYERLAAPPARGPGSVRGGPSRGWLGSNELYGQGQYAQASELFQKTLAIRREILGEDHPDTATSYNNLAVTLQAQGKYAEAEAMLRKALGSA